ncbi:tyrosine-type recombinase/integrase [Comamonas testosteroni]|uniref:tyrosine-type recombinase/integrase n=1 Tax=Comamonas testosteroni TaxID=285 RepID=UPI0006B97E27|nr:site-specific integrase [Comamonas testosteroni]
MAAIRERKDQNGKVSYQAQVRIQGYPPQSKTFLRKTDAKQWAIQTETEIRTGMTIRKSTASKHTVREMLERYRDNVLIDKANGGKDHKTHIAWWIDELGHYALSEVTTDLVTRSMDKLKKSKTRLGKSPAPATVLRYLMALSHAFNVARKQWNWCESSPVENVQRPKVKNERTRYLTDAEREALLRACKNSPNADLYLVVLLAISTGMRKGEIMGMRWQDIHTAPDQSFTRVHLTKTKNDKARSVLLTSPALELMEERRIKQIDSLQAKAATGLIFPSAVNANQPVDLRKPWGSALQAAGIEEFRFHDLRHTTASYLAMNGASLLSISKVLGHQTTKMTERYSHLATSHIDEVVRSMNAKKFATATDHSIDPNQLKNPS